MKHKVRMCSCLIAVSTLFRCAAISQSPGPDAAANAKILSYIDGGWDTLSRSMSDCKSLVDPKVATAPILYLPADMATSTAIVAMQKQCKVEVRHLPRKITHMGDVRVAEIPDEGLLYLPNRYVVPGGRFNEMYGWDSYFIILGLIEDGRTDLAKGMVENFFYEIENYGGILNANRTYYFTRSQPPFLSSMIRAVYDSEVSAGQRDQAAQWLHHAYEYASRDHALWTAPFHKAGDTGLARYYDLGEGPVEEMADDSTYYPDVIHWLLSHPEVHTDFLVTGPDNLDAKARAELAKTSCDLSASIVCAHAHVGGHWLSRDFYKGDRAMRESGFDPAFRYGPFSGWTHHNAPSGLNSLLYKYERDLAWMAEQLGDTEDAKHWNEAANQRRAAINKYLWNPKKGMYYDYDFMAGKQSTYDYLTTFYPLWAGVADAQQATVLERHLLLFEHDGGLAMSDSASGTQWDLPFGWAPTNWLATKGLAQYGFSGDASRIAKEFSQTVRQELPPRWHYPRKVQRR